MRHIKHIEHCHKKYINKLPEEIQKIIDKSKIQYKDLLDKEKLNIPTYSKINIDKEHKQSLENAYNRLRHELIKKYKQNNDGYHCAYCSLDSSQQIDHFLPKQEYPELTVVCYNLVPVCSVCNGHKSSYLVKYNYHPFYNKLFPEYLTLKIEKDKFDSITFKYELNISLDKSLKDFLVRLDLCSRYEDKVRNKFINITRTLIGISKEASIDNLRTMNEPVNYEWEKLFYTEMINNIDIIFDYCQREYEKNIKVATH